MQTVSVVVPTYRRVDSLRATLGALETQRVPAREVIVAWRLDDEETRGAIDDLVKRYGVRSLPTDAKLQTFQMDAGARVATGNIVAFTDDDGRPRPDWVERLLGFYRDPTVGAVGGRDVVHDPAVSDLPMGRRVGQIRWFGRVEGNHHLQNQAAREVCFLKGVNLSLRRELWVIDHELAGAGNQPHWELGVCLAIRRQGFRILFDPETIVDHHTAARVAEPQRAAHTRWSVARDAHNEIFELARWLPAGRRHVALGYGLLVGNRVAPGPALFLPVARQQGAQEACALVAAAWSGRLRALRRHPRRQPMLSRHS